MATLRQTFYDIADAIRAKGISGTMKPIEMASKIDQIQKGFDYGYLTFTAEEATTLTLKQNGGIAPHKLLKSTDGVLRRNVYTQAQIVYHEAYASQSDHLRRHR